MNSEHDIVTITGADNYPLKCRLWHSAKPTAIVVLVHGIVSHSEWLDPIAARLAKSSITCLAFDRRGSGLNVENRGHAKSAIQLLLDLAIVLQWAQKHQLPIHLCGFCWGANYVVNFLDKQEVNISSVMLLSPSLFPSTLIQQRPFETGSSAIASEEPVMTIESFTDGPHYQNYIKPDPLRLQKVSLAMNQVTQEFSTGVWMKLLRLTLPCQIILADNDDVVDNEATQRVFDRMKSIKKEIHTVPGRHGIQFDSPALAATLMQTWVNSAAQSR